ncbi:MAG: ribonucleoside-diphosphate reductase subunit alpha [Candidatus Melainabacteria bacterium]|nr:MAG: ribonucleoside-diphosphate reductase subunit alpha [Candidatus Melainabacteria bacterium]
MHSGIAQTGSTDQAEPTFKVLRRNNTVVDFEPAKIALAMKKAFIATEGGAGAESSKIHDLVDKLTNQVVETLKRRLPGGGLLHIEHIQDQVELALMRAGEHEVARRYILYREQRAKERAAAKEASGQTMPQFNILLGDGTMTPIQSSRLFAVVHEAVADLKTVSADRVIDGTINTLYEGVKETEVFQSAIYAAKALIEHEPDYSYVAARLLLDQVRQEVLGEAVSQAQMAERYAGYFPQYLNKGIEAGLLDHRLSQFDLNRIGAALKPERDLKFQYLGLQTLVDRYLVHVQGRRIELPQAFWMRVAMGLAINELDREERAIQFYEILSSFDFVSSTPTLFNSGTHRPQLSSCFLTTVDDDLSSIYDALKENALLSKFSGGLGNDWTPVRALGAHIKGTNGKSQGVVPFLKVVNDTAVAVNQGGKRKGAVCCYLETWHLDIEEFLELRKNTGDDRRRTHDMNSANWIPDLFMERVMQDGDWTLFSPDEVSDLHNLYGQAFKEAYEGYEQKATTGEVKVWKKVSAKSLWRKMLSMLFETGHPWMTFKDVCNLRSPQQHVGVVHSSNLCTEITLNTSSTEIAVCNLGSVNLVAHLDHENKLDVEKIARTCRTAMRMLDNVIDINYYSVDKARRSNFKHRPVGLGVMGFQDILIKMRVPYASDAAVEIADFAQEVVSYYAILASSELAEERGVYSTYKGSLWDKGILPQDSVKLLAASRDTELKIDESSRLDWGQVREHIARVGMRNSNCLAIAPTATISNIIGVSQSIEPTFQNLFVKSNLSGDFTVLNQYLVQDLKNLGIWDEVMVHDLKYFDGSVKKIERIPEDLKNLYATAFEIDPTWLVKAAARRQKWIDQAQSLNLYMSEPNGRKLDELYKFAWSSGLKTTYYLRTTSATAPEKSTVQSSVLNAVKTTAREEKNGDGMHSFAPPLADAIAAGNACSLSDPDCEACQ